MSKATHLNIYQCPVHKDFITISLETEGVGGERFFTSKCCPSQYGNKIKSIKLSEPKSAVSEFINALQEAIS